MDATAALAIVVTIGANLAIICGLIMIVVGLYKIWIGDD